MLYICTNFKGLVYRNVIFLKRFFIIGFCVVGQFAFGQRHEIGAWLGASNLVGDIGRTNYIMQKPIIDKVSEHGLPFYAGIMYRMNFNPYQTVRFDLGYSHIQFDDRYAKEQYRINRGLWGTNSVYHADAVFEYNFLPVNDEQKSMLSPYIFGGIGAAVVGVSKVTYNHDFKRDGSGAPVLPTADNDFTTTQTNSSSNKLVMSIPFGVGLKYKFNYNWALSGEFRFRPTLSDAVDYSVIEDKDVKQVFNTEILQDGTNKSYLNQEPYRTVANDRVNEYLQSRNVGNMKSKDWVNTVSIGLSYSFGRMPCYCD